MRKPEVKIRSLPVRYDLGIWIIELSYHKDISRFIPLSIDSRMATRGPISTQLLRHLHDRRKAIRKCEKPRSAADEVPEVVALPVGTYTVVARSERGGYASMLVVIKEGEQVVLDLDLWETKTQRSLATQLTNNDL